MKSWNEQIDEITKEFIQSFGAMTGAQLNWKPDPNTWSIGQNIDHLMVINETYVPILQSIRQGKYQAPWHARFKFLVILFGKIILKAVEPERKKKMKTFPIWEPSPSKIADDVLQRFIQQQERLKERISVSKDLIAVGTVIHSPANRVIVYTLETAFAIMITHERRHLNQAREVLAAIRQPS